MAQYISKSPLVAEFNRLIAELIEEGEDTMFEQGRISAFEDAKLFLDTLEVKESKLPNPRFPHLNNIVDKIFGAGNLESWEYEEAEQLVLLAKEELLKDLEVEEVDLDKEVTHYLLYEHCSPLNEIMHNADLKSEVQYYKDIENAFKAGFELGFKAQKGE